MPNESAHLSTVPFATLRSKTIPESTHRSAYMNIYILCVKMPFKIIFCFQLLHRKLNVKGKRP